MVAKNCFDNQALFKKKTLKMHLILNIMSEGKKNLVQFLSVKYWTHQKDIYMIYVLPFISV